MEEASIAHAFEKIEAALARIENASRDFANLQQRHEHLKATVSSSIAEMDQLIAGRSA